MYNTCINGHFIVYNNSLHRSLGVLLYTLVYGAMPFDGSNFKRLVKQITTGDYYEPKHPSREFSTLHFIPLYRVGRPIGREVLKMRMW